tara:strand:- start:659 stop:808 length:150 start_codon:yes stop_codon:yes gene_type:complete
MAAKIKRNNDAVNSEKKIISIKIIGAHNILVYVRNSTKFFIKFLYFLFF